MIRSSTDVWGPQSDVRPPSTCSAGTLPNARGFRPPPVVASESDRPSAPRGDSRVRRSSTVSSPATTSPPSSTCSLDTAPTPGTWDDGGLSGPVSGLPPGCPSIDCTPATDGVGPATEPALATANGSAAERATTAQSAVSRRGEKRRPGACGGGDIRANLRARSGQLRPARPFHTRLALAATQRSDAEPSAHPAASPASSAATGEPTAALSSSGQPSAAVQ